MTVRATLRRALFVANAISAAATGSIRKPVEQSSRTEVEGGVDVVDEAESSRRSLLVSQKKTKDGTTVTYRRDYKMGSGHMHRVKNKKKKNTVVRGEKFDSVNDQVAPAQQFPGGPLATTYSFHQAHFESIGFLDDIPQPTWELMKRRVMETPDHLNPEAPMTLSDQPAMWYRMNWEPNFTCPNEKRIGGLGQAFKWVCNPHRIAEISQQRIESEGLPCLVYSVGKVGEFAFEQAFQREVGVGACEIHVFDPEEYTGKLPANVYYHPWGFEAERNENKPPNFKSLRETIQLLGHQGRVVDVFRIDCEGCEWRTHQDWFNSGVDVRQILVETHQVPHNANELFQHVKNAGYVTFHKEANTWSAMGASQEYSFIRLHPEFFA